MRPLVVIGAGGHAKVVIETLRAMGRTVQACAEGAAQPHGDNLIGVPIAGDDELFDALGPDDVDLAIGVGIPHAKAATSRLALADHFAQRGYVFPPLVHPSAIISVTVALGQGVQILAGSVVQASAHIGDFTIVNTRASIDHDSRIGRGAHIAPGAILGGAVTVGDEAMVGLGAAVLPGMNIGSGAMVGAGAVVIRSVERHGCVKGMPAR